MNRVFRLALEDSMGSLMKAIRDATIPLDQSQLSNDKIHALEKHHVLLEALDSWMLIADMSLRPKLMELAKIVHQIYKFSGMFNIYRGFDVRSSFQDTMGLSKKGFWTSGVIPHDVGYKFRYKNDERPLSFTTHRQIAGAFGNTVVSTTVSKSAPNVLILTDELMYIISEMRRITPETQKEVIILPPFDLSLEVLQKH